MTIKNPEFHDCECGHRWLHGQSGAHDCGPYYRQTIRHLRDAAAAPQVVADDLPTDPLECAGHLAGMAFGNCPADEIGHCVSIITAALSAAPVQAPNPVEFDGIKNAPVQAQELDHGDTVLRVQAALGCTDGGWISPDVILLRIEQLKASIDSWRDVPEWAKPATAPVQPVAVPDGPYTFPIGEDGEYMILNRDSLQVGTVLYYHDAKVIAAALAAPAAQGDKK